MSYILIQFLAIILQHKQNISITIKNIFIIAQHLRTPPLDYQNYILLSFCPSYHLVTTCPILSAPKISCSPGNDGPGDTCTFTCDDVFELKGTESRICQDDLIWSGFDDTFCLGKFAICDQSLENQPLCCTENNYNFKFGVVLDRKCFSYFVILSIKIISGYNFNFK